MLKQTVSVRTSVFFFRTVKFHIVSNKGTGETKQSLSQHAASHLTVVLSPHCLYLVALKSLCHFYNNNMCFCHHLSKHRWRFTIQILLKSYFTASTNRNSRKV